MLTMVRLLSLLSYQDFDLNSDFSIGHMLLEFRLDDLQLTQEN